MGLIRFIQLKMLDMRDMITSPEVRKRTESIFKFDTEINDYTRGYIYNKLEWTYSLYNYKDKIYIKVTIKTHDDDHKYVKMAYQSINIPCSEYDSCGYEWSYGCFWPSVWVPLQFHAKIPEIINFVSSRINQDCKIQREQEDSKNKDILDKINLMLG